MPQDKIAVRFLRLVKSEPLIVLHISGKTNGILNE